MSTDRSWINRRCIPGQIDFTREFLNGIDEFVNFAERNCTESNKLIRCPCCRCRNTAFKSIDDVKYDILAKGFNPSYTVWNLHEEVVGDSYATCSRNVNVVEERDDVVDERNDVFDPYEMLRDASGYDGWSNENNDVDDSEPNDEATKFYNLVNDAGVPIYPGNTKYTKLSFVTKLLHFKSTHGCSERGFNELLNLIGDVLPEEHKLPSSYYEIKKMVKGLKLGYQKIHACENDCMLFYGDDINFQECKICGMSRYRETTESGNQSIPRKVLRYFPLTPRLQRLYMSSRTAESMRWHKTREIQEGILSHPADGEEWKQFDINYPDFANEIRNVRIGLAADGFSPFNDKSSRIYSVWPVIIVVYNLPPSMCMKDPYMFMTLLIPEEKSPTRDINIYLKPLIDELCQLWNVGVQTYDAFKRSNFTLRAALFWTISDFPGLAMVSEWSTKGKLACSVCMGYVKALHLKHSRKSSYWGTSHQFKKPRRGRQLGIQIRKKCERISFPQPGKLSIKSRADGFGITHNWTHFSIFFDLPYWDSLCLRHCIDVMHTEKNVFDNVFHTVLDTNKSKDNNKSRGDLKELGIRENLWMRSTSKPKAPYVLSREQQIQFYTWVNELRMPDGCASNIARCSNVKKMKLSGMKSHDCHVFMQKLLPSSFRGLLPDDVHNALCNLSNYFKELCSSALVLDDLVIMEKNIVKIMCTLENIFPPSFFDSMEHLPIHLAEECRLGGPVQYRWMYPFERQMRLMKMKVGNKARVEGSIAERYTEEELIHFCSLYFDSSVQTVHNRLGRNIVNASSRDPAQPHRIPLIDRVIDSTTASRTLLSIMRVNWPLGVFQTRDINKHHPQWWQSNYEEFLTYFTHDPAFGTAEQAKEAIFYHMKENLRKNLSNERRRVLRDIKKHGGTFLSHRPDYHNTDVWRSFCEHWDSLKFKKKQIAAQNSRRQLVSPHTSGATSFQRRARELKDTLGREPTKYELFLHTHTKRGTDDYSSVGVQEIVERYLEICRTQNMEPNSTPINTWIETVGVRKNTIIGVPRTRASDIIPSQKRATRTRRRRDGEESVGSTGRSIVQTMSDDIVIRAVDSTLSYARANPDAFELSPDQVNALATSVAQGESDLPADHPLSQTTMRELVHAVASTLNDIHKRHKGKSIQIDS